MIPDRSSTPDARAAFWRPVLGFLKAHADPAFRVEVVPTANHWEAYYLPRAGFALARGWYRQLDLADNRALYAPALTATAYRSWLRRRAVRYVVVPRLPLEAIDGSREAALVRSGRAGLREVWSGQEAAVYELAHPTPILTGPGRASVSALGPSRIAGRVGRPGAYLLRVHFDPYWSVTRGSVCLTRAGATMTRLHAVHAGRFAVRAIEAPGNLLGAMLDTDAHRCGRGR